ncbi:hypothetical protein L4D06_05535 [Enterovibrio makurazakiensis]|uniref:hypothetical protein n=1 Tax=Enterovibrio makurazakiensis TaxID=2910232 RepID=UPI003D1A13FD
MSQQYKLHFVNNSTMAGDICVYQKDPNLNVPEVMSLAWFSKGTNTGTKADFTWNIDYSFIWDETGVLIPGVIFDASQNKPADLTENNVITLTKNQYGYEFDAQQTGEPSGSLVINQDATIPSNQASVGIGMSGNGTYAVQAQPNIKATFTPHPVYWLTFGTFEQGQVLDIGQITNKTELKFPPNVYEMYAELTADNKINVSETPISSTVKA